MVPDEQDIVSIRSSNPDSIDSLKLSSIGSSLDNSSKNQNSIDSNKSADISDIDFSPKSEKNGGMNSQILTRPKAKGKSPKDDEDSKSKSLDLSSLESSKEIEEEKATKIKILPKSKTKLIPIKKRYS